MTLRKLGSVTLRIAFWLLAVIVLAAPGGLVLARTVSSGTVPPSGYAYVIYGTVHVRSDGSMYAEEGGRIEVVPYAEQEQTSAQPEQRQVEVVVTEPAAPQNNALLACVQKQAVAPSITIGNTNYRRTVDYCVTDDLDELVQEIYIRNIGFANTPVLQFEYLGYCAHPSTVTWQTFDQYIITPGATLHLSPWHMIQSSFGDDGRVSEVWPSVTYYSCLPD